MTRQITLAPGSGNDENSLQSCQADTESYKGHFANARVLSRQTIESALQNKNTEIAATRHLAAAIREVEFGHPDLARANVDSGLSLISTQNVQILAAVVLARAGEPAKAEALADDLANRFPLNTMLNVYWLPVIRAAIALARNDPSKAVERLKPAAAYDFALPTPAPSLGAYIYPVYLRGQAFLLLGNGDDAAAQFEKFRERRALAANSPLAPLAPLGLARAYTLSGDRTKARAAYEEFLTQWKDADPDIPALLQAKAEYAKLN
jgi:predicted Zn-dependent protease